MRGTDVRLDEEAYCALKARAALTGQTIDEMVNEAIRNYLATVALYPRNGSLRDLRPQRYPEGSDRLSEQVDTAVYVIEEHVAERQAVLDQIEQGWSEQARRPTAEEIDDWIGTGRGGPFIKGPAPRSG